MAKPRRRLPKLEVFDITYPEPFFESPEFNLWLRVFLDCFLDLRDGRRSKAGKDSAEMFLFDGHYCFDLLAAALD